MADSFPTSSVPAPKGREHPTHFLHWVSRTNPPPASPAAPRWHYLPVIREPAPGSPTAAELEASEDRVVNRYGEPIQLRHIIGALPGSDVAERCLPLHHLKSPGREPALCTAAALDARIVGASETQVASTYALTATGRRGSESRTARRAIWKGDYLLARMGVWPWAVFNPQAHPFDQGGRVGYPIGWPWWEDARVLPAFIGWWAKGWAATRHLACEVDHAHQRAFGEAAAA